MKLERDALHIWAGLSLLDRGVVDRDGNPCGNVDDLELTQDEETGTLYVSAVLCGPGILARRLRMPRFGAWREETTALETPARSSQPACIPFERVADIADVVRLAVDEQEVATYSTERWFRDHVVAHIPGSSRAHR